MLNFVIINLDFMIPLEVEKSLINLRVKYSNELEQLENIDSVIVKNNLSHYFLFFL